MELKIVWFNHLASPLKALLIWDVGSCCNSQKAYISNKKEQDNDVGEYFNE